MNKWYAIYTKSRNEKKVADFLVAQGYEVYLPLITTKRKWSDRVRKVQIPLFSSYVFLHINFERCYHEIITTPGVVKFVRIGKEVATIRQQQIDYIRQFLTHEAAVEVVGTINLVLQQEVEIVEGPFRGMKGKLVEHRQHQCFAVEIEQIGANLLVSLPAHHMQAKVKE
jgi:transcription antitermination factor NusG